jgi:glycosyltransferase involved in cell wall biosynthesis
MRIAFVCHEYPPALHGGIGTWTQTIARGLASLGHEVRVVGVYGEEGRAHSEADVDRGVRITRIAARRHRAGWTIDRAALFSTVAPWARRGEVDLVEVPDWQGWAAGWPALPVPIVVRLHGSETYFAAEMGRRPRRLTRWIEAASLRRADYWCGCSRYTAEKTRMLFRQSRACDAVLYNPIPYDSGRDGARRSLDVVFSGTLTPKKGIEALVEAWPLVRRDHPGARLHVFGKDGRTSDGGSMRASLEARLGDARQAGLVFHGHVDRDTLLERLRRARLAVFPSWSEAFAIAPLEAMACGCPTIGTTRASGRELIDDGVTGLLGDPADPVALAAAITRLLADDELAARLGLAGQNRVREAFSLDALIEKNVAFYSECLARFAAARRAPAGGPRRSRAEVKAGGAMGEGA